MRPVRPEFLPESSRSREEMEALQRDIAAEAVFDDDFDFDPAAIQPAATQQSPTSQTQPSTTQQQLSDATATRENEGENDTDHSSDAPLVAGIDQAFLDDRAISAVVVLQAGEVVERTHAVTDLSIPYIPGLLAFREGGPIVAALETLDCEPDLLCVDGSGRIHYRQAGLATHIGVVFDTPSVGIAKNLLCGSPRESVAGRPTGWRTAIEADDAVECPSRTVIGYAYQSRQYESSNRHINPLYVSPGHRVAADTAVEIVAACGDGYKLPAPTRLADSYAAERKAELSETED